MGAWKSFCASALQGLVAPCDWGRPHLWTIPVPSGATGI